MQETQPRSEDEIDALGVVHYGKLKPSCWKKGRPRVFLGPQIIFWLCNCIITCFFIGLLQFLLVCPLWQRLVGFFLNFGLLWDLISIGISDPGMAVKYQNRTNRPGNYCMTCRLIKHDRTRHCETCDVCIEDYDHHCIFLGKCIGADNMGTFKSLLCFTCLNFLYFLVVNIFNLPAEA